MNSARKVRSTPSSTSFCTLSMRSIRITTSMEKLSGRSASTRAACSGRTLLSHHRDRLRVFVLEVVREHRLVHVAQLVPHGPAGRAAYLLHDLRRTRSLRQGAQTAAARCVSSAADQVDRGCTHAVHELAAQLLDHHGASHGPAATWRTEMSLDLLLLHHARTTRPIAPRPTPASGWPPCRGPGWRASGAPGQTARAAPGPAPCWPCPSSRRFLRQPVAHHGHAGLRMLARTSSVTCRRMEEARMPNRRSGRSSPPCCSPRLRHRPAPPACPAAACPTTARQRRRVAVRPRVRRRPVIATSSPPWPGGRSSAPSGRSTNSRRQPGTTSATSAVFARCRISVRPCRSGKPHSPGVGGLRPARPPGWTKRMFTTSTLSPRLPR